LDSFQREFRMKAPTPSFRVVDIVIGFVCGLIVLGLLALFLMVLFGSIDRRVMPKPYELIGIMAIPGLGIFFGVLSYRLITGRGAKAGGGLLSPSGWRMIGIVFVILAGILFIGMVGLNLWGLTGALLSTIVFAAMCFYVAIIDRSKT
jgi:hypothetical protein